MGEVKRAYTRCPVCDHDFRAPAVRSYVTIGRESDLCPKFPGRISDGTRLIQNAITMCPNCSFAATEGVQYPPGVHLLPREVQDRAAKHLLNES